MKEHLLPVLYIITEKRFKYNGKEFDEATGYYYYGARYYDPKRSFWISVDPLAEITQSPYTYVWNDPVNFADPSGCWENEWEVKVLEIQRKEVLAEEQLIGL
jgi:RHS repeat-associated protein